MRRRALSPCAVAAALACAALGCHADVHGAPGAVVDGTPTGGDPAVVALVGRRTRCSEVPVAARCTGTLVAPRVVLTAAHCLSEVADRGPMEVFFGADITGPGELVVVAAQRAHPDYDPAANTHDVGLLLLAEEAPVAPHPLPTMSVEDLAAGAPLRVVGFGVTARGLDDSGLKREGSLALTEVRADQFDAAPDPSNTCVGDSGGPVFATLGGVEQLIGVTSRGDVACVERATSARLDVELASFVEPFLEEAARAPLGWPEEAAPIEVLESFPCARDGQCPALLSCEPGAEALPRCILPGLGPGAFGAACADDAECEGGACARLWPQGPDACRCHDAAFAPPPVPPEGEGSCAAGIAAPAPPRIVLLHLAAALLLGRRRSARG